MLQLERQNYRKNVQLFRKEQLKLAGIVGELFVIHHVGSTAIPKMSGKNILDVLIGAPNNNALKSALRKLESSGYFPGKGKEDNYIFLASKIEETGSGDIHVHLTLTDSKRFKDFLHLKNYLLQNPKEAKEYRKAKHLIARKTNSNRSDYKKKKSEYVTNLLKKARCFYETTERTDSYQAR